LNKSEVRDIGESLKKVLAEILSKAAEKAANPKEVLKW
jgi:hypothetical protein